MENKSPLACLWINHGLEKLRQTVKSCTDNTLVLTFNGETHEFEAYEEAQEILDATENE